MKTYTLQLTMEQIRMLGTAIGEIPTKFGAPLAAEINRQVAEQMPKPTIVEKPQSGVG